MKKLSVVVFCALVGLWSNIAAAGGSAACPGCVVTVVNGAPVLTGTPIPPDNLGGLEAELHITITGRYVDGAPFSVSPGPIWNMPMYVTGMSMPPKPQGAVLRFVYWDGFSIVRMDPPFSVPLHK